MYIESMHIEVHILKQQKIIKYAKKSMYGVMYRCTDWNNHNNELNRYLQYHVNDLFFLSSWTTFLICNFCYL